MKPSLCSVSWLPDFPVHGGGGFSLGTKVLVTAVFHVESASDGWAGWLSEYA